MKKKLFTLLAIVILIQPSMVLADKIDNAGKYLLMGEPANAETLIQTVFKEDPFNVKKHIRVGKIYWENGYASKAYNHFFKASRLEPTKVVSISQYYLEKANQLFSQGKYRQSLEPYQKAFLMNPALKFKTLEEIFHKGELLSRQGLAGTAYDFFNVVQSHDNRYREKIAEVYFQLGNKSNFGSMLELYKIALKFSPTLKNRIETKVIAKLSSGEVGKAEKKAAKQQVKKLVSNDNFKILYPPDYRELKVGEEYLSRPLNAGEKDDLWIRGPQGIRTIRSVSFGKKRVKILTRGGKEYCLYNGDKLPGEMNYDIKFVGVDNGAKGWVKFEKE